MDKILSKDTIKNVFSALGAKTSDSNYGVALLDKTSGEPKGFMGMSDLASVLGVGLKKIIYGGTLPNIWTGEVENASDLVLVWDGNNVQDYWIGIIHSTNAANLWKSEVSGFASKSISLVSQSYSITKIQTTSSNPDFHYFAYRLI